MDVPLLVRAGLSHIVCRCRERCSFYPSPSSGEGGARSATGGVASRSCEMIAARISRQEFAPPPRFARRPPLAGRDEKARAGQVICVTRDPADQYQSLITTSRPVPDSPPQASPGRPSIWRTLAERLSLGKVSKLSDTGSKRWIAFADQ